MTWLLVTAGAAVGAPLRFLVDRLAREASSAGTILGTLIVNVAGSALLGLVAGWPSAPAWCCRWSAWGSAER